MSFVPAAASLMPSVEYNPIEQKMTISVSGVLRKILTYAVPSHRATGTGATRIPATIVPRTSASTAEYSVSLMVTQNESNNWVW